MYGRVRTLSTNNARISSTMSRSFRPAGAALNPHFHFHVVVLDDAFSHASNREVRFHEATGLTPENWLVCRLPKPAPFGPTELVITAILMHLELPHQPPPISRGHWPIRLTPAPLSVCPVPRYHLPCLPRR